MNTFSRLLIAGGFTLSGLLAGTAFAAEEFTVVDVDGDGQVTMEELQATMPDLTDEKFKEADEDESGSLSEDEYAIIISE